MTNSTNYFTESEHISECLALQPQDTETGKKQKLGVSPWRLDSGVDMWQQIPQHPLTALAFLSVQSLEALCVSHPQWAALQWHHSISFRRTIEKKWLNVVRGTGRAVPVCVLPIKSSFFFKADPGTAELSFTQIKRHKMSKCTNSQMSMNALMLSGLGVSLCHPGELWCHFIRNRK